MTSVANNLEYAPPLPLRKRRAFRKVWVVVALIVVGTIGVFYYPWAWLQVRLWYWQQQCTTYEAPADQIVCEEAPSWGGIVPPFVSTAEVPKPLRNLEGISPVQSTRPQGPVLYLHERTSPSGQRRLLMVRRVPPAQRQSWDAPMGLLVVQWRVRPLFFADAGLTSMLQADPFPQTFDTDQSKVSLRLHAGRSDPNDASRFTIQFVTGDGGGGILEGTLNDVIGPTNDPVVEWKLR